MQPIVRKGRRNNFPISKIFGFGGPRSAVLAVSKFRLARNFRSFWFRGMQSRRMSGEVAAVAQHRGQ
jgi:protein-arginine kinase